MELLQVKNLVIEIKDEINRTLSTVKEGNG